VEIKIEAKTVISNEGGFEPHPESYTPRVFAAVWERGAKVYEILSNGQAIPWPCLPVLEGFDYWVLYVAHLSDVDMRRARKRNSAPPFYSKGVGAFLHPDPVPQADGYSGTLPEDVTWIGEVDGKKYTGLRPKSGNLNLDHLPEGSY
jgi:hypothetical protein